MSLFIAVFPIVLLIFLMVKRNSWPAHIALPAVAVLTVVLKLLYSRSDAVLVSAVVVKGALTALTPIVIIYGAILLFRTQENTGAMDVIRQWLQSISANRVAQVMVVGWAFSFLIEGASGFGTPAALAAPILVGLGFKPVNVAMLCLVMNSVPVSFGAVGTPTWFGFSEITNLSSAEIIEIGIKSSVIHLFAGLCIPVMALKFLFSWAEIWRNLLFIFLSILSCTVPMLVISLYSYEFPSLLGGLIGVVVSIVLARKGIGLDKDHIRESGQPPIALPWGMILKNTFPLWATVLVLVLTRIPGLGLKSLLLFDDAFLFKTAGPQNMFSVSYAGVIEWSRIFATEAGWKFQFLYVPGLIPFVVVSLASFVVLRSRFSVLKRTFAQTNHQMVKPVIALVGSLVFVNLLMMGGADAYVLIIGSALADVFGNYWSFAAAFLGALGSFFSGSNTISNLTFGSIQDSIAAQIGLTRTTILAMQSVGGAMGNMVCINNIVAVCSVLGLINVEGQVIKRTVWPMIAYGLIAGTISVLFLG